MEDRKHGEKIIDHTPKTPFLSPLQKFMKTHCDQCDFKGSKCRLEDSRGLTPMSLCIALYPLEMVMSAQSGEVPKELLQHLEEVETENGDT